MDPQDRAEERLEMRIADADKKKWLSAAERANLTLSAWIRDRLDKAATREAKKG